MDDEKERELLIEIATRVKHIETQMNNFITKEAFKPVAWIVYALAATILTTVLVMILRSSGVQ